MRMLQQAILDSIRLEDLGEPWLPLCFVTVVLFVLEPNSYAVPCRLNLIYLQLKRIDHGNRISVQLMQTNIANF